DLERASERCTRRHSNEQAFPLAQPSRVLVSLLGVDLVALIRDAGIIDSGHYRRLHVFESFEPMKRRVGLKRYNFDIGVQFFQPARRTHESPARSEAGDEMGHSSS